MEQAGYLYAPCLASGGVYITPRHRFVGELLPRLSILTQKIGRFFSVALSLKSPSQVFHLHPCPMMLGLSSRYFYPATVRLTRSSILTQYTIYCNDLGIKKQAIARLFLLVLVIFQWTACIFPPKISSLLRVELHGLNSPCHQ